MGKHIVVLHIRMQWALIVSRPLSILKALVTEHVGKASSG